MRTIVGLAACIAALLSLGAGDAGAQTPPLVLKGARIYTVSGAVIENGTLVVTDGKITAVGGPSIAVPSGATVRDVSGKVIMPGLVDTHSHVGIYPRPSVAANQDGNEMTSPTQGILRAIDAIWPADPGIRMALAGGVTTANIMPGSGNVMGGQTAYVKLRGGTIEEMLIFKDGIAGGMKMANGENPKRAYGSRNMAPSTRMAVAALQRRVFVRAQDYRRKWDEYRQAVADAKKDAREPDRDLELEPVVEILEGKRTVHFHTHRADDIMTVLRLADEFHFSVVLQHVTEGYKVAGEIARRHVPASIIVIDSPGGKHEAVDSRLENGGLLERAGVKVAIHTDDYINSSRFLMREAALAVRGGMTEAGAFRALTLNGAEMLGLGARLGSLDPGKDADFVVLSGHPFSAYTHVLETYIEGVRVFDRANPADAHYATGGFGVASRYPALTPAGVGR